MKLALKITPQRSTQYASMTGALAGPELLASPLGESIASLEPIRLAGRDYLLVDLKDNLEATAVPAAWAELLPRLGALSEGYEYFTHAEGLTGPLLRPFEPHFKPFVPVEMAEVRRYRGKTNELFTRVLLNLAIFAGGYREQYAERLRILDPLAGGGTTLFLALASGYDVFGIEQNRQDVETTEVFVRQYLQSEHITYKELDEKGRKAGRRFQFEIGPRGQTRHLILVHGETAQAVEHLQEVPGGPRVHAIVGDLPYGIQHFSEVVELLTHALPAWERLLLPGGVLALAWNATRIDRATFCQFIADHTSLHIRDEPPYTQLAHTVDRVIKQRDVVLAVRSE
jgi:hypothetical protein